MRKLVLKGASLGALLGAIVGIVIFFALGGISKWPYSGSVVLLLASAGGAVIGAMAGILYYQED